MSAPLPKGWTRGHLGDFFEQRQERGKPGLPTFSVTMNDGLVLRDELERRTESTLAPEEHLRIRPGDIAYNMMRMWQGACGRAEAEGMVSPAYVVLAPKKGIDTRFAYHWFKSEKMLYRLWAYSHGITGDRLRLYFDDFRRVPVEAPSLDEQQKIACALDAWDEAIRLATEALAAKRLRYSAFVHRYAKEFHDQRTELSEFASLRRDRFQPGAPDTPATSVELENIEAGTGRVLGTTPTSIESALRSRFFAGDTLFGKLRPYLRKFARPDFDGACSTEIWVLHAIARKCDPALLFYIVQTPDFSAAASKQSGSKMPRAEWDLVSATPLPLPRKQQAQREALKRLSAIYREGEPEARSIQMLEEQKTGLAQRLMEGNRLFQPDTVSRRRAS